MAYHSKPEFQANEKRTLVITPDFDSHLEITRYLLTSSGSVRCGSPIREQQVSAHVLGKLQVECVYLLITDVTNHKR